MIELSAGAMSAMLAPQIGGAVLSLSRDGRDILRPAPSTEAVAEDPRRAACYPCAPWFGRLYAPLEIDGHQYALAPTLPAADPAHALHGEGWINPWRVVAQSRDHMTCRFEHAPAANRFPCAFAAEQQFLVRPNAFEIRLWIENTGEASMPAGLGLHPFFIRTPETVLDVLGRHQWRAPPDPAAPKSRNLTFGQSAFCSLSSRTMDHSTEGWNGRLRIAERDRVMTLTSNAPILHVYAPADQAFFCAEPVTHLPGYFGKEMLAPGERKTLAMSIAVDA